MKMAALRTVPFVFVFLFMLGTAFAAAQTKSLAWNDQSTHLYETESAGYGNIYVTPGFNGAFSTTLTTGSKVLSYGTGGGLDGAVMCPGASFSLSSSMSSLWSSPTFYASTILIFPVSSSCPLGSSSSTGGDHPVSWDLNTYEATKDWSTCYPYFANCWDNIGALYDKRVNMYLGGTLSNPLYYYNRQGTVGIVCWGTRTPSASTPSGSYPGLSASDTGATSWSNSLSFSSAGTYTIYDGFEVKGCAATIRQPACSGDQGEETYSRLTAQAGYDAAEYYSNLGSNSYTITIQNRQMSVTCGPTNPSSPISVPSGDGTLVAVTIHNSGDVAIRVTGVSSSNTTVSANPFNMALCGTKVPNNVHPCDLSGNGFNAVLASHASETVYIWTTSSAPIGTTVTTNLRFSYSTSASVCNAASNTCQISGVTTNVISTDTCSITDGTMPVTAGDSRQFSLTCAHQSGSLGPCTGASASWSATPAGFGNVLSWDNTGAVIQFPGAGSGDVSATVTGGFNATCKYSAGGQNVTVVENPSACRVTDGTMPVVAGQTRDFNITCSYNNSPYGPCTGSTVTWGTVPTGFATIGTNDYQGASVYFPAAGTGDVNATVHGGFNATCSYSSTVGQDIIVIENVTRCEVTPNPANVGYKEIGVFALTCYGNTSNVLPCGAATWSLQGLSGPFLSQGPTGASFVMLSSPGTRGTLQANVMQISCTANITSTQPTNTIDITPPSADLNQYDNQTFNVTCTTSGSAVACSGVLWNPFGDLVGSLSGSSDTGTVYFATTDNITTTLWACAMNLHPSPCDYASIVVGAGDNGCTGPTCCTGAGCGDEHHGSSDKCTIFGSGTVYPGGNHFSVLCGDPTNLHACSDPSKVSWTATGGTVSTSVGTSTFLYPGGSGAGTITAIVPGGSCPLDFFLGERQCLDYS